MRSFRLAFLLLAVIAISCVNVSHVLADDYSLNYTENDIQTYDPTGGVNQCTPGDNASVSSSPNVDPTAKQIYDSNVAPQLATFAPLYQQAAKAENIADWQIIAGIQYRESGLTLTNPANGDGLFQMTQHYGNPSWYTPGKTLSTSEFTGLLEAMITNYLEPYAKGQGVDLSKPLAPNDVMKTVVAYNSGPAYNEIHIDPLKSAYAWSGYNTTQYKIPFSGWIGDSIQTDTRPGAVTIWALLKGTTTAMCTNSGTGGSNVVFMSQRDPRWANISCGACGGTYGTEGCYQSDLAMIASTFSGKYVDPPQVIGQDPWIPQFASAYNLKLTTIDDHYFNGSSPQSALDTVQKDLTNGSQTIILVHGKFGPIFLVSNHWVIIRGYANGNYQINDPYDLPQNNLSGPPWTKDPTQPAPNQGSRPFTNKNWPNSALLGYVDMVVAFNK